MLPLLATATVAATGDIYFGLWYPVAVAMMTVVVGALFLRDAAGEEIAGEPITAAAARSVG